MGRGYKFTTGNKAHVYYLNCNDGFMGTHTHEIIYIKYVQFVAYQLCLNRAVKNKWANIICKT